MQTEDAMVDYALSISHAEEPPVNDHNLRWVLDDFYKAPTERSKQFF